MAFQKFTPDLPAGLFLTDEKRTPDVLEVIRLLPAGIGVVFRHYRDSNRSTLALEAAEICRDQGRVFLIAGDASLAWKVKAGGLHLPRWILKSPPGVLSRDPRWLLTASAHSVAGLRRAEKLGADAILLSPVFPTKSHPGARPLGFHAFARLCAQTRLPVYALGGITRENFKTLESIKNLAGPAGISLFWEKPESG